MNGSGPGSIGTSAAGAADKEDLMSDIMRMYDNNTKLNDSMLEIADKAV